MKTIQDEDDFVLSKEDIERAYQTFIDSDYLIGIIREQVIEITVPPREDTVFVGVIPGVNNLAGIPFRTDLDGSYHKDIEGAIYSCKINGGYKRYFCVEERYWLHDENGKGYVGNVKKIHHFNTDLPQEKSLTIILVWDSMPDSLWFK